MIECTNLEFQYPGESFALQVPSLSIDEGEAVALIGPSGAGKTTLMNLIAGIYLPDRGSITVKGCDQSSLPKVERQRFRIRTMGLVPQNFDLLDYLTAAENILTPFRVSSALPGTAEMEDRCRALAKRTGIADLLHRYPRELSQGERQRVAICRGLITEPDLILADEPTGNLDPENQEKIVSLLLEEAGRIGATVVMITHERELRESFERVVDILEIRQGGEK